MHIIKQTLWGKELFIISDSKNYPRYPVDLFKIRLIFLETSEKFRNVPYVMADVARENPFGTAFIRRAD